MSGEASKALVVEYLDAISGNEKPAELVDRYVSDADSELKAHIQGSEAAFPRYELRREAIMAEGDLVAVRFRLVAVHGETRKPVDVPGQIWYRVQAGKIVQHWIVMDNQVLMQQLGAGEPEATQA